MPSNSQLSHTIFIKSEWIHTAFSDAVGVPSPRPLRELRDEWMQISNSLNNVNNNNNSAAAIPPEQPSRASNRNNIDVDDPCINDRMIALCLAADLRE